MSIHHTLPQQRHALIAWMADRGFTHALTLNTDREMSAANLREVFGTFCHEFDRAVLGRNLKSVPRAQRLKAMALAENLSTNAHLHAVADLALAIRILGSETAAVWRARDCWLKATNGAGSFWPVADPDIGWGRYSTKRFDGTYFLSEDYWPH